MVLIFELAALREARAESVGVSQTRISQIERSSPS
jgi:hypothetical protein